MRGRGGRGGRGEEGRAPGPFTECASPRSRSPSASVSVTHDRRLETRARARTHTICHFYSSSEQTAPRACPPASPPAPSPARASRLSPAFPPNPSCLSQLTVKSEAVPQSQAPSEAPAAAAVASSCRPRPGARSRAAAMAPGHEAPRLPGLGQTPGGAQEKPMELPAVAVAPTGAAAAQADDARARGGARPAPGRRGLMTWGAAGQHGVRVAKRGGEGVHRAWRAGSSSRGGAGRPSVRPGGAAGLGLPGDSAASVRSLKPATRACSEPGGERPFRTECVLGGAFRGYGVPNRGRKLEAASLRL